MAQVPQVYADRAEAGEVLAGHLMKYMDEDPVVVGLPRGGVVVAAGIARALGCVLDIIYAGKLGAPFNPELAIGAVTEDGAIYINKEAARFMHISENYIEREKEEKLRTIKRRLELYRKVRPKVPLKGRTVIIADDGLATGSTMICAVQAAAASKAKKIVVAVPGGPSDTLEKIRGMKEVSEVVCPLVPYQFYSVSQLYLDFGQVEDEEVVEILSGAARPGP